MEKQRSNTLQLVLGVILLAVCVWWILGSQPEPEVKSGTNANANAEREATGQVAQASAGTEQTERATLPGKAEQTTEQTAPPPLAHVRGRCIAAENGEPLAGCRVEFSGSEGNSRRVALHGSTKWQAPEPVVTGADGRFDIAFTAMPPFQHSLNIETVGRAPRTARWGAFRPGQIDDLGDIAVQHGYTVSGQVVDRVGVPVKGVTVHVIRLPLPIRDDMAANDSRRGYTDEKGFFTIRVPIPSGSWPLSVSAAGMSLVEPDTIVVSELSMDRPVRIVLRHLSAIRGHCVDQLGRPMASVHIAARSDGSESVSSDWSEKDGAFTLWNWHDDQNLVVIETSRGDGDPLVTKQKFAWGTTGIRLVLKRNLELNLTVIEKKSRKPVARYAVSCQNENPRGWARGLRLGGVHPDGKVVVDHISRGQNSIHVVANDRALHMLKPVKFLAQDPGIPGSRR